MAATTCWGVGKGLNPLRKFNPDGPVVGLAVWRGSPAETRSPDGTAGDGVAGDGVAGEGDDRSVGPRAWLQPANSSRAGMASFDKVAKSIKVGLEFLGHNSPQNAWFH